MNEYFILYLLITFTNKAMQLNLHPSISNTEHISDLGRPLELEDLGHSQMSAD
jgi:hypothetical protein